MAAASEDGLDENQTTWHKKLYGSMRKNILGILFVLALTLIGGWVFSNLDFAYKTISQGVFILPDDIGRIYYPEHLLLFSEPAVLQVDFTQKTVDPLTVIVHFPDSIQAQVSPTMTSRIITLTVAANETITTTKIALQNAGTWTGWWDELTSSNDLVKVEGINGGGAITMEPETFNITLEGRYKGAIRQFLSSTVNQNSPLILASVGLIALTRVYLDYQDRQRKEREEEEKKRQNIERANREIEVIRTLFCQVKVQEAKHHWKQFQDSSLRDYVLPEIKEQVENLLQITDGKWITNRQRYEEIKPQIKIEGDHWLSARAGAVIAAYREKLNTPQLSERVYAPLRTDFPIHKLHDVGLRDQFWRLRHQLEVLDLQPWRPTIIRNLVDRPVDDPLSKIPLRLFLGHRNPLLYSKAEADQRMLFEEYKGFWSKPYSKDQSMVQWLALLPVNYVLYGNPGCGFTSMAYALHGLFGVQSEIQQSFFMVHFSESNLNQLKIAIANELLTYICNKPTLFLNINDAVRNLCAYLLIHTLGIERVRVVISETLAQKKWLEGTTDDQKLIWDQVSNTQLELFSNAIDEANRLNMPANDREWLHSVLSCVRGWGFRGVKIVVECPQSEQDLLQTWLHSEWFRWESSGFVITLFVHMERRRSSTIKKMLQDFDVAGAELSWQPEDLMAMVTHRFQVVCQKDVLECFDSPDTFATFIKQSSGSPQNLIRLWHRCLSNMNEGDFRITSNILKKAGN